MTRSPDEDHSSWIRWYQPRPDARFRLVCMPHAGGTASFFLPMTAALGAATEVLAIQYPGRHDRIEDPLIASIGALAEELCAVLLPRIRFPFALFGHSMGALAALELAGRLEAVGLPPAWLFVSGAGAPVPRPDRRFREADDTRLMAELRRLSGTDPKALASQQLLRLLLPAIRNDIAAAETYKPREGTLVTCPITALVGDADPVVSVDDARAWSAFTRAAFDLEVFTGGHFYLARQRHHVAEAITRRLATSGADPRQGSPGSCTLASRPSKSCPHGPQARRCAATPG
jgi:surfactin synthase thioesterase subunit